jgi:outer membrane protein assembly factor BamB
MRRSSSVCALGVLALLGAATTTRAADWPQWRGPDRNGLSKETGLLKTWPTDGPKVVWKASGLGEGHATPATAGGKVYGMGLRGSDEVVWALDAVTGKVLWSTKIADGIRLGATQGGHGSRATPTVEGDRLYALGVSGELASIRLRDGAILWQKSLVKDFGGQVPTWGYSESPLVDGDRVIATPGGEATVVALNKRTGETLWKAKVPTGNDVAYASSILATFGGKKQVIQMLAGTLAGIDIATGAFLWQFDAAASPRGINCSTPIYSDGLVFGAAAYQHGGALGKLTALPGGGFSAEQVYFTKSMRNHHGGMVLVNGYLYGFDESNLTCIEFKTGKVMWSDRSVGKGSVVYADGHLVCRSERGTVGLVEATPTGYVEKGRFEQTDRSREPSWPYPVVSNGRLLLRDQDTLICYDLKETKP